MTARALIWTLVGATALLILYLMFATPAGPGAWLDWGG